MQPTTITFSTDLASLVVGNRLTVETLRARAQNHPAQVEEELADMANGTGEGSIFVAPLDGDGMFSLQVELVGDCESRACSGTTILLADLVVTSGAISIAAIDDIAAADTQLPYSELCQNGKHRLRISKTASNELNLTLGKILTAGRNTEIDATHSDRSGPRNMVLGFSIVGLLVGFLLFILLSCVLRLVDANMSAGRWYLWPACGFLCGFLTSVSLVLTQRDQRKD